MLCMDSATQRATATLRMTRLMLLAAPLLLVLGILAYAVVNHRVEDSISSYYLGPARDLFVAMLVATGVLLVAYRGEGLEDYALNLAGFYAVFVALVPTQLASTLAALDPGDAQRLVLSVRIGVVAVLLVSACLLVISVRAAGWLHRHFRHSRLTMLLGWGSSAGLLAFLALLAWRTVQGTDFAWVHGMAAFLMIASMGVAIASHLGAGAWCPQDYSGGKRRHYALLLVLMVSGLAAWPVLKLAGISQALFVVEWFEILLFAWFWLLESRRLWHEPAP